LTFENSSIKNSFELLFDRSFQWSSTRMSSKEKRIYQVSRRSCNRFGKSE